MGKTEFELFTLSNLEYRHKTAENSTSPSLLKYFTVKKTQILLRS